MSTGDTEVDLADADIALLFRLNEGFADTFSRGFDVDDLALPDSSRSGFSTTENVNRAARAGLADDNGDFRSADF